MEENEMEMYENEVKLNEALDVMIENWIQKGDDVDFETRQAENYSKALTELFKAKAVIDGEDDRREIERMKAENDAAKIRIEEARVELEKMRADTESRRMAVEFKKAETEVKKVKAQNTQTAVSAILGILGMVGSGFIVYETWNFEQQGNFIKTKNACQSAMRWFTDTASSLTKRFR